MFCTMPESRDLGVETYNTVHLNDYTCLMPSEIAFGFFRIGLESFLVQSFKETLQYCDEWRKFTSVSQSVSQ